MILKGVSKVCFVSIIMNTVKRKGGAGVWRLNPTNVIIMPKG